MTAALPAHLRKVLRQAKVAGVTLHRDGDNLLLPTTGPTSGPAALAAQAAIASNQAELALALTPRVSREEAERVRGYLGEAGVVEVQYVIDAREAEAAVAMVVATVQAAGTGGVIGLDMETMPLAHLRQPIPIALTQSGSPAARQPKTGAGGLALDPYQSQVRTVQVWDGGQVAYVFDVPKVGWSVLTPLWALPLAIYNATFELKRLLNEADHAPTGRIYDVMTACRLTHGVRPKLFAAFSAAWVLPALVGPLLAGLVTTHLGWRWVFLGMLPLIVLGLVLLLPALRRLAVPDGTAVIASARRWWALVSGLGIAVLQYAGQRLDLLAIGLAVGTALALAAGNAAASLLYGLKPRDPLTLAGAILGMTVVAFIASLLPARRAAAVHPMVALREE